MALIILAIATLVTCFAAEDNTCTPGATVNPSCAGQAARGRSHLQVSRDAVDAVTTVEVYNATAAIDVGQKAKRSAACQSACDSLDHASKEQQIASQHSPPSCDDFCINHGCDCLIPWEERCEVNSCANCLICMANCTNPDIAHGESDSREMFVASSVNAPAKCQSQSQSRTCHDGVLSSWTGSYTHVDCKVQARCVSPDTAHGDSDSRQMFAARSVNAPATCQSEVQNRACSNGAWASWSGSYTDESCVVMERCTEPDIAHGESDFRDMHETMFVNAPAVCQSQAQTRTCNDGVLSSWSGSYTHAYMHLACYVLARCSNPDKASGESETRVRFKARAVGGGAECESEAQNRGCSNGQWQGWTGNYTDETCIAR